MNLLQYLQISKLYKYCRQLFFSVHFYLETLHILVIYKEAEYFCYSIVGVSLLRLLH